MFLGIDIGGTKTAVIRADDDGKLLDRIAFPTKGVDETLSKVIEVAKGFEKPRAAGISCGGPLDEKNGLILSPPNLIGWDEVPVCQILSEALGCPVGLCNDANACALAEWKFGAGVGTQNMIFLTFGTGLGAGLILDGRLYSGTNGNAGEAGHMSLTDFGPVGYGKAGAFEGWCSGGGLRQIGRTLALEKLQCGKTCAYCKTREDLDRVSAKVMADAAREGDETALEAYRLCGEKLGYGLSILIDLFNPEAIVIGSIFVRSEDLLRPHMEKVIEKLTLPASRKVCRVLPAKLGEQIGDYAAVSVAMMQV